VKQYYWKFKISPFRIDWGQSEKTLNSGNYFYYFGVDIMDKEMREAFDGKEDFMKLVFGKPKFGLHKFWYDGPHAQLNLYYICFYWSTPWTSYKKEYFE
jgi:hypothetical protein